MPLLATQLERKFKFINKGQTLDLTDPDPGMSPQAVLNFYANTYPELITAKISEPKFDNDQLEYKFETVMGTKG
ncbi:PRTRC system protein C [Tellurirhabdus bombi]|uniref:PRTRC system protein C n=1 Tax=Tellurirhabdus bombi TaxID=2907205 RepID=UPI001F1C69DE|nr:PRTRC system protein C [Tellurirhabdus bombi]